MKQDEIIEMARQADALYIERYEIWQMDRTILKAFAKLVAAKEREACAKVCDDWDSDEAFVVNIAEAIRARSGATSRGEA
jgi:hypothetical protein